MEYYTVQCCSILDYDYNGKEGRQQKLQITKRLKTKIDSCNAIYNVIFNAILIFCSVNFILPANHKRFERRLINEARDRLKARDFSLYRIIKRAGTGTHAFRGVFSFFVTTLSKSL